MYYTAKTKALMSFAVTAKLICALVFAYADCWFSHEATHLLFLCYLTYFDANNPSTRKKVFFTAEGLFLC